MLKNNITSAGQFEDEFRQYGRGDQFSYGALGALFEYYEELSEGIGEDIQIDVIGICCEWCEYDSLEELAEYYDVNLDELEDADSWEIQQAMDDAGCSVQIIEVNNAPPSYLVSG